MGLMNINRIFQLFVEMEIKFILIYKLLIIESKFNILIICVCGSLYLLNVVMCVLLMGVV